MVDLVARRSPALWRGIMSSPMLTLGGWFAFNLPRAVTATGQSLLAGLVAMHVYVWTVQPGLPGYFAVFAAVLTGGCLTAPASSGATLVCPPICRTAPPLPGLPFRFSSMWYPLEARLHHCHSNP